MNPDDKPDLIAIADQAVAESLQMARVHGALFQHYIDVGFTRSEALVLVLASISRRSSDDA